MLTQLEAFGIPLEGLHTETGPGVYEAAIAVDDGMRAADNAALFKTAVKEIAARHGLIPTFMAKWNAKLPGSSGHLHQSLWQHQQHHDATCSRRTRRLSSARDAAIHRRAGGDTCRS